MVTKSDSRQSRLWKKKSEQGKISTGKCFTWEKSGGFETNKQFSAILKKEI